MSETVYEPHADADNDMSSDPLLQVAIRAARRAGNIMREHFGTELQVDHSEHHDIKLLVDKLCESEIIATIRRDFPDHAFVTEESNPHDGAAPSAWIVDPLDGTVNFAYGVPHFCTSIAFRRDGRLLCGVIYNPNLDEIFTATLGGGAFRNGCRIAVSIRPDLEEAVVSGGFAKSRTSIEKGSRGFSRMASTLRKLRITGSAALDMAYVACGRYDAYIENDMNLWDVAAGTLLVREAGGCVTARRAGPRYDVLGTNALIHEKLADFLHFELIPERENL